METKKLNSPKMQTSTSKSSTKPIDALKVPTKQLDPRIITTTERIGETISVFSVENSEPLLGFTDLILFVLPICLIIVSYIPEIINVILGGTFSNPNFNNLNFNLSKDNIIFMMLKDVFLNLKILLLFIPFVANILISLNYVKKETLTIFEKTGVQTERSYYSGKKERIFIPMDRIKQVVITEALSMNQTLYHLGFVVTFKKKMILPFSGLHPSFRDVFPIYMKTRTVLYGEPHDDKKIEEFLRKHGQL